MIDVSEHLAIAQVMVNKLYPRFSHMYEYEDFRQTAYLGLVKARINFKEELGYKFSTLAYKTVFGEIMRFVQDDKRYNKSRGVPHDFKTISYEYESEEGCLKDIIGNDNFEDELINKMIIKKTN